VQPGRDRPPGRLQRALSRGFIGHADAGRGPGSTFTGWNGSKSREPSILLIVGLPFPGDRIVTATFER